MPAAKYPYWSTCYIAVDRSKEKKTFIFVHFLCVLSIQTLGFSPKPKWHYIYSIPLRWAVLGAFAGLEPAAAGVEEENKKIALISRRDRCFCRVARTGLTNSRREPAAAIRVARLLSRFCPPTCRHWLHVLCPLYIENSRRYIEKGGRAPRWRHVASPIIRIIWQREWPFAFVRVTSMRDATRCTSALLVTTTALVPPNSRTWYCCLYKELRALCWRADTFFIFYR